VFTSLVFVVGVGGEDDTRLGGASSEGVRAVHPDALWTRPGGGRAADERRARGKLLDV